MHNVRACARAIKLIEMCLYIKNCFSAIMEKFFKTPTNTSTKKRKRSINPLFLDKYRITDVSGKRICVVCSKELAEESLKPNELQRHMKTHVNTLLSCQKRLAKEFSIIVMKL